MPKQKPAGNGAAKSATTVKAERPSGASKSPVESVRDCADALFRAADECCYQHDRISRILTKSSVEAELNSAQRMCELTDKTMRDLSEAYQTTSADVHPTGADESWWRNANTLWMASREYLRRHKGCDVSSRQLQQHGRDRLEALHADYELEASALLSLRHAADAYRQSRPSAA
ncbi:MAG TPA: hypothetical protein VF523_01500 [Burkholderiales bacterium]